MQEVAGRAVAGCWLKSPAGRNRQLTVRIYIRDSRACRVCFPNGNIIRTPQLLLRGGFSYAPKPALGQRAKQRRYEQSAAELVDDTDSVG
jgi:hypothetical protein